MPTRVIGFYAKGCIAGADALPINGETWQVMRFVAQSQLGAPAMVALLKRLADKAHKEAGWPGILVGDMSQPRGGPMITGHAQPSSGPRSDIWLTPMPNRQLSRDEREKCRVMMVRADRLDVDPSVWTPNHLTVIRAAAREPSVQRIFVNAAIRKRCAAKPGATAAGSPRCARCTATTNHFHIRIKCPRQRRMRGPAGAIGKRGLQGWRSRLLVQGFGNPPQAAKSALKPRPPMTLAQLPAACRQVLAAPDARQ